MRTHDFGKLGKMKDPHKNLKKLNATLDARIRMSNQTLEETREYLRLTAEKYGIKWILNEIRRVN